MKSDPQAPDGNAAVKPVIFMIRHGEKPAKDAEDQEGLSEEGKKRAEGLVEVFGNSSGYNIKYILAEHPKRGQFMPSNARLASHLPQLPAMLTACVDGDRERPVQTITPLAKALGIDINDKIDRDADSQAADATKAYSGPGNVLVCWEHGQLAQIAEKMGINGYAASTGWTGPVKYPGDRFDLIWTVRYPYDTIDSVTSEGVEALDHDQSGQPVAQ
jgi:hypothetical protein